MGVSKPRDPRGRQAGEARGWAAILCEAYRGEGGRDEKTGGPKEGVAYTDVAARVPYL
jgi:hypothetical protein